MIPAVPLKVDEELWSSALLAADTELLLGAARNYLGPVKTPYDKREIVERLTAFLRRPDVRQAILSLLDALDARILGSFFILGPLPEVEIRSLFEGELPLFDLGIRLANLQDRLLLFRFELGGRRLLAPNPVLADVLQEIILDPVSIFGVPPPVGAPAGEAGSPDKGESSHVISSGPHEAPSLLVSAAPPPSAPVTAKDVVALFTFLFHAPTGLRKSGALTKKSLERAEDLLPDAARLPADRLPALLRAFDSCGFLGAGRENREPDLPAFSAALAAWGETFPAWLAATFATGPGSVEDGVLGSHGPVVEMAAAAAAALGAAPEGFPFSRGGLNRWLEIALRRARRATESGASERRDLVDALLALGIVVESDGAFLVRAPWKRPEAVSAMPVDGQAVSNLVAEGSHALHLLPEASLEERLLVGMLARPTSFATVWSFEVDRESARRAFAAGLGADDAIARLAACAGRSLPQSLTFSLKAWEDEYRSLRLYRGFVLVADERLRHVVEHSKALAPRIAERLGPGVYVLAASSPEEVAEVLEEAGLEAPPEIHHGSAARLSVGGRQTQLFPEPATAGGPGEAVDALDDSLRARVASRAAAAVAPLAGLKLREVPALDPRPRIGSLLDSLESSFFGVGEASLLPQAASVTTEPKPTPLRGSAELRELADRIERRLILTPRQLATAEVRPERLEATGLDYLGKVRIVERSLRGQGDRLELLYRLPGAEPKRIFARPVRLEKTEKGLVLEAEDLGTGEPVRVSLGAVSSVRRMRASLFGEDT